MKTNFVASAPELRSRAWNAMTATWSTVLWITFVINVVTIAANYILAFLPLSTMLYTLLSMALSLALIIPQVGLTCGALTYLRRGHIEFGHIRSMFPYWRQVVCYSLWEGLYVCLWALPGLILSIAGLIMNMNAQSDSGVYIIGFSTLLSPSPSSDSIVFLLGLVMMFALPALARLNYMLGRCFLIDAPGMGGRMALAKSRQLMRGHRWRYIRMSFPVLIMEALIAGISFFLSRSINPTLVSFFSSILSIAPEVMLVYLTPVLYQELNDRA